MNREQLILENMPLVSFFANRYARGATSFDDARGDGYVGLIRAADSWDKDKGEFGTWAAFWITSEIRKGNRHRGGIVPTSSRAHSYYQVIKKMHEEGRSTSEISAAVEVSKRAVAQVLQGPTIKPDVEPEVHAIDDPVESAYAGQLLERIRELPDSARRYMSLYATGHTSGEIARHYGVSPQAVNLSLKNARRRLV